MNAPEISRVSFIGGSDIGAIVGVSKFKTALDIYLEKRGEKEPGDPDPQREKVFRRGKRLEPVVLDMLAEERGVQIIARNQRYIDAQHDFMACEVDAEAMLDGSHENIEVKTSHPFARDQWGDEDTDEIDVSYTAQALWGLGITGRSRCVFAVLIGSDNLVTYEVKRDEALIAGLRSAAFKFWHEHVLAGVPPEPRTLPDVFKLFRKAPASTCEATAEVAALCEELELAKQAAAVAEDKQAELKFQIGRFMLGETGILLGNKGKLEGTALTMPGKHLLTLGGAPILTLQYQQQTRLDGERLKRERPEIVSEYQKAVSFFRFNKPTGKKR